MSYIDLVPSKERIIVQRLRDFIDTEENYTVAIVSGMRKVGKTTVLKQLGRSYGETAVYVDLSEDKNFDEILDEFLSGSKTVLLLDEIQYLPDFEPISQSLYNLSNSSEHKRFKVIMTGSSAVHLTKLSTSKLGGGRARLFRLPPITFVEYLYFTGRIGSYTDYKSAGTADFADYLCLKGLTDLTIQFNDDYFDAFYREVEIGNKSRGLSYSLVDLESGDLLNMARLIAYKLGEPKVYDKTASPVVGGQERYSLRGLTPPVKFAQGVDLSDAMVAESAEHVKNVSARDKGRILAFMLHAGLASIEFRDTGTPTDLKDTGYVMNELESLTEERQLRSLFDKVSICLTTPLFYTRLGEDILARAGVDVSSLYKGDMLGKMLEVYARGAACMQSERRILESVKLDYPDIGEVDVYGSDMELLLELSISNKSAGQVHLCDYFKEVCCIRVCSTRDKDFFDGAYHRIPYPVLCCMLDTGDIYSLPCSKTC